MRAIEFRFSFNTRDFDTSVQFYKDTLGLTQMDSWDSPEGRGAVLSVGGRAVIELYGPPKGQTYQGPPREGIYLAIRLAGTPAVDVYYQRLQAIGANLAGPPETRTRNHYSFIVYDPDGIPVHIYCELKPERRPAPQAAVVA